MISIQTALKSQLDTIVSKLYDLHDVDFKIEHPANENFGDYATNVALILSKPLNQSPRDIANAISYELQNDVTRLGSDSIISKISVAGPGFINMYISNDWLKNLPMSVLEAGDSYGSRDIGHGLHIALEHSNVNPNKAAHVGHLRNACIGQFLERTYEFLGYSVEVQYYANNIGVQAATSNMGISRLTNFNSDSYKKFDHYAWDVYAAMETKISEDPALQEERQELLKKLENSESPEFKFHKELADKILLAQLQTFSALDIAYDVVIYESDILNLKMWEKAFTLLQQNPNVYKADQGPSAGCWLLKMDENDAELTPQTADVAMEKDKIIVRSNGIPTYTGKDIAYHMWKFGLLGIDFNYEEWKSGTQSKPLWVTTSINKSNTSISFSNSSLVFDVIGGEQTYAMDAVKKSLKYLGYETQADNMKHINYGFVFVSKSTALHLGIKVEEDKKFYEMSGRKGWGVKIDDFIELVDKKLQEKYGEFEYSTDVRNAAIKLQMLKTNTFQDLIFDLDDAIDPKGYSGPYMQYVYVRTNSLTQKSQELLSDLMTISVAEYSPTESEMAVLRWLYRFPEVVEKSATDFAPNTLADYLFELSKRYNTFYNSENILKTQDLSAKKFRLLLNSSVGVVIKNGLNLLGINTPQKM